MNVSCTSCSAKYGIPDEKVRGKKVKITCKHCGTAIVVDGTTLDAPAAAGAPAPAPVAVAASPAPKPAPAEPELSFDIAYPDDRQETLPLGELVSKYAAGTLTDEAFVWREGMTDWKAPREVPEIATALGARGLAPKAAAAPKPAVSYDEDEATKIQVSPFDSLTDEASGEWREPAKEAPSSPQAPFDLRAPSAAAPAAASPAPSPKPAAARVENEAAKPTAARRSAARGGGDLFGDLAAAGSEEDESLGTDAKDVGPKLTGARNESSVLFSLDALVKQEQKPAPKKAAPKQDDAAAFLMGSDASPNSIANVGTGSFGSAFAAPDFSAPITAAPDVRGSDAMDAGGAPKKRGGMWLALVAVLIIGGGAAAMVLTGKLAVTLPPPAPSTTEGATKPEAKPEVTPASSQDAPAATASASGTTASSAAPSPPSGGTTAAGEATGGGHSTPAAATKLDEVASKPAEKPAERPAEKPTEKPTEKPAETASSAPPFDTAAAKVALGAAAGNAGSCKTADGPTGGGKVSVTFMPSGRATNTQVSGDLAGTAVGGCVARLFRTAKVPAFSGDPVTVSKSFSIQ